LAFHQTSWPITIIAALNTCLLFAVTVKLWKLPDFATGAEERKEID